MSSASTLPTPTFTVPAGVAFVQVGGARGRICVTVVDEPTDGPRRLVPGAGGAVAVLGVVHGRHGMLRLIRARLETAAAIPGWYRPRAALAELRAQWRAGNVIWLAGVGDTSAAAERVRTERSARLLAEPGAAPWLKPASTARPKVAVDPDALPDDLPEALHGVADEVLKVIDRIAQARGSSVIPTRMAVGRALAAYPDRNHVSEALDLEHFLVHGDGRSYSAKDVVQRYRRQLDRRAPTYARPASGAAEPMQRTKTPTASGDL